MPSGLRSMARVGVFALSVVALSACSAPDTRVTIVDGWSIGPEFQCEEVATCEAFVDTATEAFTSGNPWHSAIVRTSVHEEGSYPCKKGGGISQITRSGGAGIGPIVLFELADGSRRALSVGYPLGSNAPVAHGHGPEVAPWNCSDGPLPTAYPTEVASRQSGRAVQ
jgi:hypothetical protein